jgi:hypothetical protein
MMTLVIDISVGLKITKDIYVMYITNDLREDAFGAQYQSIIWSILYAECNNHVFIYSDIVRMLGDYGYPGEVVDTTIKYHNIRESERDYVKKATECMNIKGQYPDVHTVGKKLIMALKWPYFYSEIEQELERYHNSPSFEKIRRVFFENKRSPFDSTHTHVAVHVRRKAKFDVRTDGVKTPDSYYISCMKLIQETHTTKPLLFHIYSQGEEKDFDLYKGFPIQLHLEDDTFLSFTGMAFADILILSESSMSYTAGLLSTGIVIYKPFWHPPRRHWYIME